MVYKVDLHEMTVIESKVTLKKLLDTLSYDYDEVLIVHGYHGRILMDFVRKEFKHKRIKQIIISLNPGETSYLLKNKEEIQEYKKRG